MASFLGTRVKRRMRPRSPVESGIRRGGGHRGLVSFPPVKKPKYAEKAKSTSQCVCGYYQTCIIKRFQNRTLQIESSNRDFIGDFCTIFLKAIRLKSIAERIESNRKKLLIINLKVEIVFYAQKKRAILAILWPIFDDFLSDFLSISFKDLICDSFFAIFCDLIFWILKNRFDDSIEIISKRFEYRPGCYFKSGLFLHAAQVFLCHGFSMSIKHKALQSRPLNRESSVASSLSRLTDFTVLSKKMWFTQCFNHFKKS